ncbi:hypothetical protein PCANC_25776 [Puccinia coronata f. sp. avenae]|uniref:Uncharacterized protein n=1 Tax=Puccinia coronata f. sp. avenae TaxID=200324 RepID=A0A2N5S9N2_9BASI|nr:hypothetical protein PCANC_25776 [Puccinia coronata f. sp. avenae]
MDMEIEQNQTGTQDSNASIGVPPVPPPSLNESQDARGSGDNSSQPLTQRSITQSYPNSGNPATQSQVSSSSQGTCCKRQKKVELAMALANPDDPYKGPREARIPAAKVKRHRALLAPSPNPQRERRHKHLGPPMANHNQQLCQIHLARQINLARITL